LLVIATQRTRKVRSHGISFQSKFHRNSFLILFYLQIIGVALCVVAFLFQCMIPYCVGYSEQKGIFKIFVENVYNTFCFVATVNVWRGVWTGLNVLFLPGENPNLLSLLFMKYFFLWISKYVIENILQNNLK